MTIHFDERLDRRASGAEKWDAATLQRRFGRADLLPLWVADMDFRAPEAATRFLRDRAALGELGYAVESKDLRPAIRDWFAARHGWELESAHLAQVPGVTSAIATAIQLLTEPGDGVIVQPPVFFEFDACIRRNGRRVVENPLRLHEGRYRFDLEDLRNKAADPTVKLLVLCNPHNPVGRAWNADELRDLRTVCRERGVLVVTDEIHADLAFAGHRYTPLATIDDCAITCLSAAKTFNVGGVVGGVVHIRDDALRERFVARQRAFGATPANLVASGVAAAVYREGAAWLDRMMEYVTGNLGYLRQRVAAIPGVGFVEPDATYLVWLDLRGTGRDARALLVDRARLALNPGEAFGSGGAGFARMCIACPRSILAEAFDRLAAAI